MDEIGWPHAWCAVRKDLGCLAGLARRSGFRTDLLAEHLGISTRTLRREFKNALGLCLKDWLVQVRLIEVRIRLRGDESIGNIALSVGFSHPKELSREFTKGYGLTPSEFREKERGRISRLE